jgi:hypothetical protein
LIIALAVAATACLPMGKLSQKSSEQNNVKTLTSSDGQSQITIPAGWKEDAELHEEAELRASDRASEMYVIVITDSKQDFEDMSVEKHSELTRGIILDGLASPQISPASKVSINGYPGVQTEIRGTVDKINLVYIHTSVESPKNLFQIVAWTLPSRFEKNRSTLVEVIESFKEVEPGAGSK